MLNQTILVGRMCKDVETTGDTSRVVLAVNRSFKNEEGVYETDFIPCVLSGGIANNTKEYCKKGDIIGVKGRLEIRNNELLVITEKVTFLSSKKD